MKELYQTPIFDVVEYESEDIITNSGITDDPKDNELNDPWGGIK